MERISKKMDIPTTEHEQYSDRLTRAKQEVARHIKTLEWIRQDATANGSHEKSAAAERLLETLAHTYYLGDDADRFLSALEGAPSSESHVSLEALEQALQEVREFVGEGKSATILPFQKRS